MFLTAKDIACRDEDEDSGMDATGTTRRRLTRVNANLLTPGLGTTVDNDWGGGRHIAMTIHRIADCNGWPLLGKEPGLASLRVLTLSSVSATCVATRVAYQSQQAVGVTQSAY